ncbi:MAG: LPXTG cell wall anchor domain-containing protein [Acidimicrobiales bacterium]|nr:LPXTG cell wall anchor domain-containing protein [Acidimicrobiales bacterium]
MTTTTAVGSAGPTPGTLPTTGSSQELAVSLALLASLTGALLLMIGRRPLDA